MPQELKELKKLNQLELERILNEALQMTHIQLSKVKADPESTQLQLLVCSILENAIERGDPMRFNFLLDRLLGKVKEHHELSGPNGEPIQLANQFSHFTDQQLEFMVLKLLTQEKKEIAAGTIE